MKDKALRNVLETLVVRYNTPAFIENDPISIPHRFRKKQDIEIAGFWTAMLSWGQRKTIISKATELMELMDNAPHDFVVNHREKDRRAFLSFKHRTFQPTDTLYFLAFFQQYYRQFDSLETAFATHMHPNDTDIRKALTGFHNRFFSLPDVPDRTRKHVSTPARKSACKRLNMFLRWMVRKDNAGVDFGLWKRITPSQLMIPLDVHVGRVASSLGLLRRQQRDWQAVVELTEALRRFDPDDPVRYDYALFGYGVLEKKTGMPLRK